MAMDLQQMGEELSDVEDETAYESREGALSEETTPPSLSVINASPHILGQGGGVGMEVGISGQHIAVPPDLYADLKALSDATRLDPAELMRRLLQDYQRSPVVDDRPGSSVKSPSPVQSQSDGMVSSDVLDLRSSSSSRSYGDFVRDSRYHAMVRSAVSSPVYRGSPEVDVICKQATDSDQPLDLSMVKQETLSPESAPPKQPTPLVLPTSVMGASHLYPQSDASRVTLDSNLNPLTSLPGMAEGKVVLMSMQLPTVPVMDSGLQDSKKFRNRQQEAQEQLLKSQQKQQLLLQQDEQQQHQQHHDVDHELQQVFYEHQQHHHQQMQLQKQKQQQHPQYHHHQHQQQKQENEQQKQQEQQNQQQQQLELQMQQQKQQLLQLQHQFSFPQQIFSSPSSSPLPQVASATPLVTTHAQAVQLTSFPMVTSGMTFPLPGHTSGLSFSLPVSLTMASPATAAPTTFSMLSSGNILAIPLIQTLPDSNSVPTCASSIPPPPPPRPPPPAPLCASHTSVTPAPPRPSTQQSSPRSSRGRGGGRGAAKNFKNGGEMKVLAENTSFPGVYTSILKLPWSRRSRAKGDGSRGIHRHLMRNRKTQSKDQELQEQHRGGGHSERDLNQTSEGEETAQEKETREKLRQIQYEEHQLQIKLQQEQMLQQLLHEQQQQLQQKLQQDIKEKSMLQLQKQQHLQQKQQQFMQQQQQQGKQVCLQRLQEQPEGQQGLHEDKDTATMASIGTPSSVPSTPQVMFLPISQMSQQALASLVPVSANFSSSSATSSSTSSTSSESLMMVYPSSAMSMQGKAVRRRGRPPKLPVLYHLLTESAKSQRSEVREHASSTGIPLVQTQSLGSSGATLSLMHMNIQSCVPSLPFALGPCVKTEAATEVTQQTGEGRQRGEELHSVHKAGSEEELGEIRRGLLTPKRENKGVAVGSNVTPAVTSEGGLFHEMLLSSSSLVHVKSRRRHPSDVTLKAGDNFICTSFRIRPRSGKQGRGRAQNSRGVATRGEVDDSVDFNDCAGAVTPGEVVVDATAQDNKMEMDGRYRVIETGVHSRIDPGSMFQELYHCRICNEIVQAEAKVEHMIAHSLERCSACFSCGLPLQPMASAADAGTESRGPRFCQQCASQLSKTGFPPASCSLGTSTECEVCKLDLEDKLSLVEHYQTQHPEVAPARSAKRRRLDATESRTSQATTTCSPSREACFICPEDECPRVFFDEAKLAKHMKRDHGRSDKDKSNNNLGNDDKKMPTFAAYDGDEKSGDNNCNDNDVDERSTKDGSPSGCANMDPNALRCDWPGCSLDFDSERGLNVHLAMHREEKPLKCEFCDYRCRQQNALNWHMRKHPEAPSKYRKYTVLAGGDT